jgi:hypothetical protein
MSKSSKLGKATMSKSLSLILNDIVKVGRENDPSRGKEGSVDSTLLWLAGSGLASVTENWSGQLIWVATPLLIDRYEMGDGREGLADGKKAKIRLDKFLEASHKKYFEAGKRIHLPMVPKRNNAITLLLGQEAFGTAIACTNAKGHLVWKASPKLRDVLKRL